MVDDLMRNNAGGDKRCPRCGAVFSCGAATGGTCWCGVLPRLTFVDPAVPDCLCPDCLKAALAAERSGQASG
jgi:hypothetical protein